ncbi:MAG TPA: restriction endonuclease [Ktedonobacterales bacterium]
MAHTRTSRSPSSPSHRRPRRGCANPRQQWAQRILAILLAAGLILLLLAWAIWQLLLWLQHHPLAGTALWVSALLLGVLVAGGVFYWTFRLPPPGLRGRHPRRADLARYYDQRGTLRAFQEMDPLEFEQYVGRLFELEGYQVEYTARTGDEGVDLRLRRSKRGWRGRGGGLALVQCKRYGPGHSVGSPELQHFSGALRHELAYEGYVVTTSFFTPSAQEWAHREGIHLIDGLALLHWRNRLLRRARLGMTFLPLP